MDKTDEKVLEESSNVALETFPDMTIEEIDGMESHMFALLEICTKYNFDIGINNKEGCLYRENDEIPIMQVCLPDSNLAKKSKEGK